ncbi:MAG: hypothetical protein ACOYH0_09025, partial [Saccharofermentanales bacterium]
LSSKNRWLYTNWPSYSALGGLCCPRGWTLNAAALAFCERDFHFPHRWEFGILTEIDDVCILF